MTFFHPDDFVPETFGTEKTYAEGEFLLYEGEVSSSAFYVLEGALRLYFLSGESEITLEFFFEHSVVASVASFRRGLPSEFVIQSIEPTRALVIPRQALEDYGRSSPSFYPEVIGDLEDRLICYVNRLRSFLSLTAEERYEELALLQPAVVQRVKQKYIASWLGITPESLSRIRNNRSRPRS